jgi:polysaccharide chain length determinant protein (PEP-CTERM system associated)
VNVRWQQLADEAPGVWRYRWWALGLAALITLAGWLVIFALPDRYQASAEVLVDSRTALTPALQGLAVEQDVGVQLEYVRESLLADPELRKTALEAGIIPSIATDPATQDKLLGSLRKRVQLVMLGSGQAGGGTTYLILYQDADRARALRVVSILLNTFVNETLGGKRRNSDSAQQFLEVQVKDYEQRLRTSEDRLAAFKSKHLGLMPNEQGGYFAQLQKENEEVETVTTKLLQAESRRATLESELHGDAAISASSAGSAALTKGSAIGTGADTLSRIAQTQAHLDDLLLNDTDQHPDVIATRKQLEELKERRATEMESLRKGDANVAATSGASANPVYQSIQVALNQANVEISDLRTELGRHEAKVRELRQLLGTAPQIEAEYAQLARDYDVNKAQYTALLSNLEKARLGGRADEAGSVRFEVVQPPLAPVLPGWPRRGPLLAGILMAALLAGGALAYRLDRLHPIVLSPSKLPELIGVPVVGVFGTAFPTRRRRRMQWEVWRVSAALTCFVAAFLIAVWLSRSGWRLSVPILSRLVQT